MDTMALRAVRGTTVVITWAAVLACKAALTRMRARPAGGLIANVSCPRPRS